MENISVMHTTENRNFIEKAKAKMEQIRASYKEKMIDTGKSADLERKIDAQAKTTKKVIKVAGTAATVLLTICPADGPFGEICTALATPGLCALVDLAADMKKKALITGKRGVEKHILHVQGKEGQDPNIIGYDLTSKEFYQDIGNFIKSSNEMSKLNPTVGEER